MPKLRVISSLFILALICIFLVGCDDRNPYDTRSKQINPYFIDYCWEPLHKDKHIKWVGVPGGQISVDKDNQILEFIDMGGKRYDY